MARELRFSVWVRDRAVDSLWRTADEWQFYTQEPADGLAERLFHTELFGSVQIRFFTIVKTLEA